MARSGGRWLPYRRLCVNLAHVRRDHDAESTSGLTVIGASCARSIAVSARTVSFLADLPELPVGVSGGGEPPAHAAQPRTRPPYAPQHAKRGKDDQGQRVAVRAWMLHALPRLATRPRAGSFLEEIHANPLDPLQEGQGLRARDLAERTAHHRPFHPRIWWRPSHHLPPALLRRPANDTAAPRSRDAKCPASPPREAPHRAPVAGRPRRRRIRCSPP